MFPFARSYQRPIEGCDPSNVVTGLERFTPRRHRAEPRITLAEATRVQYIARDQAPIVSGRMARVKHNFSLGLSFHFCLGISLGALSSIRLDL